MSWILSNVKVIFPEPPGSGRTAKISYRKKTDPDVQASYTTISNSAVIHIDGSMPGISTTIPDDGFIVLKVEVPGCPVVYKEFSYFPTT